MLSYAWQMERIIAVTDFVRNAARIAKDVESEGTVYRITRGGRDSMVPSALPTRITGRA
jgi:hypothetical protein